MTDIASEIVPCTAAPLLARAVHVLRCPVCASNELTIFRDESVPLEVLTHGVVVCDRCKTCYRFDNNILWLLPERPDGLTRAQRSNFSRTVSRWYQPLWRSWCMNVFTGHAFPNEAEARHLKALIDWDSLPPSPIFVDLGTSHGFYATVVAQHLHDTGRDGMVLALDFSPYMLRSAAERARRLGLQDRVLWILADVEASPLQDRTANRITCGGGLNEYGRVAAALREVSRTLQPHGQYVAMHLARGPGLIGLLQDLVSQISGLGFPPLEEWMGMWSRAGLSLTHQDRMGIVLFSVGRT